MKILLVYPPFCTPSMMPYSISYLKAFLADNSDVDVKALDLNARFHALQFPDSYEKMRAAKNIDDYGSILYEFDSASRPLYAATHKNILAGHDPPHFDELLRLIIDEKPDFVAFSLVYNSQCFYAECLLNKLKEKKINCIVGGPAINPKMMKKHNVLMDEVALLQFLVSNGAKAKKEDYTTTPDFSDYDKDDYLSRKTVIPLKSSSSCYYKQCAFCTHHRGKTYFEYDLSTIEDTIKNNPDVRHYFFIDDMISKKRLLEIAARIKRYDVRWWVQLRPTIDLTGIFDELYSSGLRCIAWGVESGSQRMLDKMKKGTYVKDIPVVLDASKKAGIKNIAYILFGFPSETKEEFMETINLLKANEGSIDLVSTTVFGLQKGSKVFEHPEEYGLTVELEPRTLLDDKISYKADEGLQREDVRTLRRRNIQAIKRIDKMPRVFNYMKEQAIIFD